MKARLEAFKHAFRGAFTLFKTQPHARFHALATGIAIIAGLTLRLASSDWAFLTLAIAMVWLAEAFNTAIEFLADEVSLEWRERIKHAKDISAFAVLIASIGSVVVGLQIFIPRILEICRNP